MLRTNTALWRIAFLSGLGILPAGCGGHASDPAGPDGPGTPIGTDPNRPTQPSKKTPPSYPSTPNTPPSVLQPYVQLPRPATECLHSTAYVVGGVDTGLERCEDGRLHRTAPTACSSKLPREGFADAGAVDAGAATPGIDAGPASSEGAAPAPFPVCTSDAECTARPLGHCESQPNDGTWNAGKLCEYGCLTDADCDTGFLCQCGDPVGTCVAAQCRTDSECGAGMLCAQGTVSRVCSAVYVFSCETPLDACRFDRECPGAPNTGYCRPTDSERVCQAFGGEICGRPFLVEGSARLAPLVRTSGWLGAEPRPDCSRLSSEQRRLLASGWSGLGLMEHASVAAFARFTLQLLSLGAPAALVEQSQQALADELVHARLCFGLASAYADEPWGPGPLPTEHALDLSSLEDIAALTLHEGCIGETIAALEASEARAAARDPAVREVLTRIEADERRHAELAWRFVIWAVNTGGPGVQRRIQRELASLREATAVVPRSSDASFDGAAHGLLSPEQRAELRAAALREVVLPCARALLGGEQEAEPVVATV